VIAVESNYLRGMMKISKLILFLLTLAILPINARPAPADDPRAQEILKQARTAVGGAELLQSIQGLSIKGEYRRVLGERELSGDREVDLMLPDKYLVEDAINTGGMSTALITTKGLNGEHAWTATSGGAGGNMFIRMGPGGHEATPEQIEMMLRRMHGLEFARYALALLLAPPPSLGVEYKYAGESDVEEAHAEAIDVTAPENFAVRLFFDKQTHMPLLLSYRGTKPRIMTAFNRSTDKNVKPEEALKRARDEADKKLASEPAAKPELVDFFIRLSDYRKVNGLLLPYKLTYLTEQEVSEEFQVAKYNLNPQFKADKFQKH
jgi:hypothetical protein